MPNKPLTGKQFSDEIAEIRQAIHDLPDRQYERVSNALQKLVWHDQDLRAQFAAFEEDMRRELGG